MCVYIYIYIYTHTHIFIRVRKYVLYTDMQTRLYYNITYRDAKLEFDNAVIVVCRPTESVGLHES